MSWNIVAIGDYCEITSSKRIFYSEYTETGVPFYRSKEIIEKSQGQEISEPLYISIDKYGEIKSKFGVPSTGDMLLTSVGTIGVPYIVKKMIISTLKMEILRGSEIFQKDYCHYICISG